MGCPPETLARIAANIRAHPESADYWLDQWWDVTHRATEWDARGWGFEPTWMSPERAALRGMRPAGHTADRP